MADDVSERISRTTGPCNIDEGDPRWPGPDPNWHGAVQWTPETAAAHYVGGTLTVFEWPEDRAAVKPGDAPKAVRRGPIVEVEVINDGWEVVLTGEFEPLPPATDNPEPSPET